MARRTDGKTLAGPLRGRGIGRGRRTAGEGTLITPMPGGMGLVTRAMLVRNAGRFVRLQSGLVKQVRCMGGPAVSR